MVYLITYDLNGDGKNYAGLTDAIKTLTTLANRVKVCESVWIVKTVKTPERIYKVLEDYLDNDDCLLITGITDNMDGQMSERIADKIESLF